MLQRDKALFRRNVMLAAFLLTLFLFVSFVLSSFRDAGLAAGNDTDVDLSHLLLALDQFNALYIVFETSNEFVRPSLRMPLTMLSDLFVYFFPSAFLESFGIAKSNNVNWQEWNAYLVGSIKSNVTPSFVGQAMVEEGIIGIILLPVVTTLLLLILLTVLDLIISLSRNPLEWLTMVALVGGTLFNIVRMFSGIYLLYFVVFCIVIFVLRILKSLIMMSLLK